MALLEDVRETTVLEDVRLVAPIKLARSSIGSAGTCRLTRSTVALGRKIEEWAMGRDAGWSISKSRDERRTTSWRSHMKPPDMGSSDDSRRFIRTGSHFHHLITAVLERWVSSQIQNFQNDGNNLPDWRFLRCWSIPLIASCQPRDW